MSVIEMRMLRWISGKKNEKQDEMGANTGS